MTTYFWDTETALIAPGLLAPPLTCLTWCTKDMQRAALLNHTEAVRWLFDVLSEPDSVLVGHNVAYDLGVLMAECPQLTPLIFAAYREDRITDTKIRQQLADIADGKFSGYLDEKNVWRKRDYTLATLSARLLGVTLEKDEWRLKYAQFRGVPIETWPEGAREYPRKDAEATRDVYLVQEQQWGPLLQDQFRQARAYWALHLSSAWGVHTDPEKVAELAKLTHEAHEEIKLLLIQEGLVRPDGSRDTKKAKARMQAAMGVDMANKPRWHKTATGDVALSEEACKASGDPILEAYAMYSTLAKVESNDLVVLAKGSDIPIQTSYGMADTGRTTSFKPNIQNIRRAPDKGKLAFLNVRETFRPREGYVFAQADYSSFELFCLAQACLDFVGKSELAVALNEGLDPHCVVAATILDRPYPEVLAHKKDHDVDMARQTGKVANFGFPGGLGAARLVDYAKKGYGVVITEDQARALKDHWYEAWPEMRDFFRYVESLETENGYSVMLPRSKRIRGNATYTAACNTLFQGVAADGAKAALFAVAQECYVDRTSPLFGSRIVAFIHDEIILESPRARAPEAAERLSQLMVQAARQFLPAMSGLKAEPCLMAYWSKKAETLRDAEGRLIVWGEKTP
jgi:hypothetical protein